MFNDRELDMALAMWECGEEIPLDMEVSLMGKGFDVQALREQHFDN